MTTTESNPSPTTDLHTFAGHAGPAAGCQKCTTQLRRQRSAAAALHSHRRQTSRQVDAILRKVAR